MQAEVQCGRLCERDEETGIHLEYLLLYNFIWTIYEHTYERPSIEFMLAVYNAMHKW